METLRRSFKSVSSSSDKQKHSPEERQSLLNQTQPRPSDSPITVLHTSDASMSAVPSVADSPADHRKEVVIKIKGNETAVVKETEPAAKSLPKNNNVQAASSNIWRDSSYDFSRDPLVKLPKDFDIVDGSPSPLSQRSPLARIPESPNNYGQLSPRDFRVSFNENNATAAAAELVRRRSGVGTSARGNGEQDEVVVCTSSSSFRRKSNLMPARTKSRLMDPPEQDQRSGRQMRSGMLGKASEIDEDDPFLEDDLPDEFKKGSTGTLTVVQWVSLILIVAFLICTILIKYLRKKTIFELELWKWELMVLVLICGRLVSGWGIRIVVFFIERNFLLRKRVLYFVYGLRKSVQNCIWLGLVLIAWQCIFDKRVERATDGKVLPYVTKIWICLLVGTLIWLLKTLLVKVLASSFHVSAFFDRIQEALFNQYVIETLSGPPLIQIQHEQEEEERTLAELQNIQNAGIKVPPGLREEVFPKKSGKLIGMPKKSPPAGKSPRFSRANSKKEEDPGITIDHLHRLNQKNISAWNMKRLIRIVRNGILSTLDEQLQDSTGEDESAVQITSENQAKIAAKKIFCNVAKPGSKHIYLEDLMRFMREDEATKAMRLFEGANESKGVSKRALKNWVVNTFRERRALALSLNDTKTAVNKLHHMLNALVGVIIIVIWLLILKVATTHFFIFISSQILLVVFMFGNTCKTTFEAVIFLFVMHPFDVGDRCEVDGVQMVVEEMNILTTVFLRYDNQKIIYPNSVLATKPISNYYRSPDMGDAIDFCIHVSTPTEKIALMKDKITRYVENKSDHWYPAPMIVLRDVEDMNRLKISVWLSHRMNHQDMGERWARRALLVEEMIKVFRELDIEYRMLPLDVNLRNMPSLASTRLPSTWTTCAN